eukprot:gene23065-biopygen14843
MDTRLWEKRHYPCPVRARFFFWISGPRPVRVRLRFSLGCSRERWRAERHFGVPVVHLPPAVDWRRRYSVMWLFRLHSQHNEIRCLAHLFASGLWRRRSHRLGAASALAKVPVSVVICTEGGEHVRELQGNVKDAHKQYSPTLL